MREDDEFALDLTQAGLGAKGNSSFAQLSIHFEGRDFEFGEDALGPVLPIDETIETIELSFVSISTQRTRGAPADIEVAATGLDLEITPTLFDDADRFLEKLLRGDQTLEFSPYLITSFACDGRNLTGGTARGGNDFIELTDDARDPQLIGARLQFAGDFVNVNAGATLRGGADTFFGSFPAVTLGGTPARIGAPISTVSGDVIVASGVVTGGNDTLNFTDSLTGAEGGLFGDAGRASGTVTGGSDEIVGTAFGDVLVAMSAPQKKMAQPSLAAAMTIWTAGRAST